MSAGTLLQDGVRPECESYDGWSGRVGGVVAEPLLRGRMPRSGAISSNRSFIPWRSELGEAGNGRGGSKSGGYTRPPHSRTCWFHGLAERKRSRLGTPAVSRLQRLEFKRYLSGTWEYSRSGEIIR